MLIKPFDLLWPLSNAHRAYFRQELKDEIIILSALKLLSTILLVNSSRSLASALFGDLIFYCIYSSQISLSRSQMAELRGSTFGDDTENIQGSIGEITFPEMN